MDQLFDEESAPTISINKKFAARFEKESRYRDLQRAGELLEEEDNEDDSSEEEEDDDAYALSHALDSQIIHTINAIRKRDPKIYDKNTKWFQGEEEDNGDEMIEKSSKKRYKDVVRDQLLEDAGVESEDLEDRHVSKNGRSDQFAYDAEQNKIRESLLKSIGDYQGDENEDDMLKPIVKSSLQKFEEEEELKRELEEMKRLGKCGLEDPSQDDFLFDYISKQKWKDPNSGRLEDVDDDADEEEMDEMDRFESTYNFRFEEVEGGTAGQVIGHARNTDDSVRRKDTKRKEQREKRDERKDKDRRQKEAELRRLKNLKRQELEERLKKIEETGGLSDLGLGIEALDDDWDPEEHEALMRQQFGDDYYAAEDDFNADDDAGFDQQYLNEDGYDFEQEEISQPRKDKKNKKNKTANPLDELYHLDYEDIVAGIPCRFKYRSVEPEAYGLEAEDILEADDKALNKFVGLKRLSTYRLDRVDPTRLSKKRKRLRSVLKELKDASSTAGYTAGPVASTEVKELELETETKATDEVLVTKRKRVRKSKKSKDD